MDSVWTNAHFATTNGNDLQADEVCPSESRIVREILKINELMKKYAYLSDREPRDSTKTSTLSQDENSTRKRTGQNDCKGERLEGGEQEIHCQLTSKSYSCLQTNTISSSTIVLKIRSKTTMNGVESENSKSSETEVSMEKVSTPSERSLNEQNRTSNENPGAEDNLASRKGQRWIPPSSENADDEIPPKVTQNMQDKTIGDTLINCPFELVEIYSSKRAKGAENNFKKVFVGAAKEAGTTRTCHDTDNLRENIMENNFAKSHDRKSASGCSKLDVDVNKSNGTFILTSEKDEDNGSANFVAVFKEMDERRVREELNIMNGQNDSEEIVESKSSQKRRKEEASVECSIEDDPSDFKGDVSQNWNVEESNYGDISEKSNLLKRSACVNDIPIKKQKKDSFEKGAIIEKEDRREVLHTMETRDHAKQCDGNNLNSDLCKTEIRDGTVVTKSATAISRKRTVSKISMGSDATVVVEGSKSDSLSTENATDLTDGDINLTGQHSDAKSGNESNIQLIIK